MVFFITFVMHFIGEQLVPNDMRALHGYLTFCPHVMKSPCSESSIFLFVLTSSVSDWKITCKLILNFYTKKQSQYYEARNLKLHILQPFSMGITSFNSPSTANPSPKNPLCSCFNLLNSWSWCWICKNHVWRVNIKEIIWTDSTLTQSSKQQILSWLHHLWKKKRNETVNKSTFNSDLFFVHTQLHFLDLGHSQCSLLQFHFLDLLWCFF